MSKQTQIVCISIFLFLLSHVIKASGLIDQLKAKNDLVCLCNQINFELVNIANIKDKDKRIHKKVELADRCFDVVEVLYLHDEKILQRLCKTKQQHHDKILGWSWSAFLCPEFFANSYVDTASQMVTNYCDILK